MNHTGIADNAGLRPDLSREQIKYLAIAAMTCNHAVALREKFRNIKEN